MVGIVIVSHSRKLAEAVVELAAMMAPEAVVRAAGGMEDGSLGTSFDKIQDAVESVYTDEGVLILADMGSAVMTAEMVTEMLGKSKVEIADCPIVEGAVMAAIDAVSGMDIGAIRKELESASYRKRTDI